MLSTLLYYIKKPFLVCFFLMIAISQTLNAQKDHNPFTVFVDSIILVNHKTYNDIEYTIYKNKYDTLKMRTFEHKSKLAGYVQGLRHSGCQGCGH